MAQDQSSDSGQQPNPPAQGQADKPQDGPQQGQKQDAQPDNKPRSKKPLIILGIVVVVLALVAILWAFFTRNLISTDDAYTNGNSVTMVAKVSGYVVALNVNDNTFVHAGDLLLQIDQRDYIAARDQAAANLSLAQAQLLQARANYDIAKVSVPAKLAQAEAQKQSAQASADQASLEYKRQHSVDQRATTQENVDTATAQQRTASAQVAYNQAQVDVAKLIPQNLKTAEAEVKQWEAQVAATQAQLAQAELNLAYTSLRAPQDGWVTVRNVQLGSYAQTGQSLFMLVTSDVWVVANFKETQLDRMRVGQKVNIDVDAYPGVKLKGHVDSIQMGSGSRFSAFPAENATGNYVKIVQRVPVKIVLDANPNLPMPLGLSVEPTVHLE